ncbi:MAG: eukaryotic-like serine/threonine-protein kinase [Thermoanaerobaculia bacterium]|nr:eukaryotic-like serine/threonine-protein kinase [Thermoanaerobaculia bacterium]
MAELLPIGAVLSHYRITAHLGSGGMGDVYKAMDSSLDRSVALKVLRSDVVRDDERRLRFVQEAKAASSLNHPNVVHIYEIGDASIGQHEPPVGFIAMEYIEGTTFGERIYSGRAAGRKLLQLLEQVAEGLSKAHSAGLVHRDLKPDNIMVSSDGYAKIVDFGLAKLVIEDPPVSIAEHEVTVRMQQVTREGIMLGTIGYMSPEQVQGQPVDRRSDIFSFGCILYEALARRRAFEGSSSVDTLYKILHAEPDPITTMTGGASVTAQRIIRRCLDKDRDHRYQSMKEVVIELADLRREMDSPGRSDSNGVSRTIPATVRTNTQWYLLSGGLIAVIALLMMLPKGHEPLAGVNLGQTVRENANTSNLRTSPSQMNTPGVNDAYIRAKVNVTDENPASNDKAIKLLESVVAADPKFAPGYAALARAYNIKSFYYAPADQKAQLDENAAVAVEKALALDPNLAEAHLARGLILWTHENRFQHEEAVRSYKQALALNPDLDEAHHQLGLIYLHVGLFDKAQQELNAAVRLNPGNTLARFRLGVIEMYRGRYEAALSAFKMTPLRKNPSLWTSNTAEIMWRLGKSDEASRLIDDYLRDNPRDEGGGVTSVRALMLAQSGKSKEAEEAIGRAIRLGRNFGHFHHASYNIAAAYALLHRPAEASQWLQVAADDGFPCYPVFNRDPALNPIRDDPRFVLLLKRLKVQFENFSRSL